MDKALTPLEKQFIRVLQEGLPLTERPYGELAARLEITEEALLNLLKDFLAAGRIRRLGATLRQKAVGYTENAMVVWDVPEERADVVGRLFAAFPQVTHCYRRPRRPGWPYNLFTMLHGGSRAYCRETAQEMAGVAGLEVYELLYSTRELKKTRMRYFT